MLDRDKKRDKKLDVPWMRPIKHRKWKFSVSLVLMLGALASYPVDSAAAAPSPSPSSSADTPPPSVIGGITCLDGSLQTSNSVSIGEVTKIESNPRDGFLYVYGRNFYLANSATSQFDVLKKNLGAIAIPLSSSDAARDGALKECANLAKLALAQQKGFRVAGDGSTSAVSVGPLVIPGRPELESSHCLGAIANYTTNYGRGWIGTKSFPKVCEFIKNFKPKLDTGVVNDQGTAVTD